MNFSRRNIIIALVVIILVLAIPLTLRLVQQQQQLKSKAAGNESVQFFGNVSGSGCTSSSGACAAASQTVDIRLRSPF